MDPEKINRMSLRNLICAKLHEELNDPCIDITHWTNEVHITIQGEKLLRRYRIKIIEERR